MKVTHDACSNVAGNCLLPSDTGRHREAVPQQSQRPEQQQSLPSLWQQQQQQQLWPPPPPPLARPPSTPAAVIDLEADDDHTLGALHENQI